MPLHILYLKHQACWADLPLMTCPCPPAPKPQTQSSLWLTLPISGSLAWVLPDSWSLVSSLRLLHNLPESVDKL